MINRILNPSFSVEERERYMTVLRKVQSLASETVWDDAGEFLELQKCKTQPNLGTGQLL
jgi:hypothetical protein